MWDLGLGVEGLPAEFSRDLEGICNTRLHPVQLILGFRACRGVGFKVSGFQELAAWSTELLSLQGSGFMGLSWFRNAEAWF